MANSIYFLSASLISFIYPNFRSLKSKSFIFKFQNPKSKNEKSDVIKKFFLVVTKNIHSKMQFIITSLIIIVLFI